MHCRHGAFVIPGIFQYVTNIMLDLLQRDVEALFEFRAIRQLALASFQCLGGSAYMKSHLVKDSTPSCIPKSA